MTQTIPNKSNPRVNQNPVGGTPLPPTWSQGPQGNTGPPGPPGAASTVPGPPGATGATGVRGSLWFEGIGAPGSIPGALPQDQYLDITTGDVYVFS